MAHDIAVEGTRTDGRRQVRVWDPLVRLFHWTVVTGFTVNLLVAEGSEAPHRYLGYLIAAAIAARLVWGFVGSAHARFASFLPTPAALAAYWRQLMARKEPRYLGHNPAGAAMMALLVVLLSLCCLTGWMQSLDRFWGAEWLQLLHRASAYAIAALAAVHVAAALLEGLRHNENLVWSMVTGRKRRAEGTDIDNAARAGRG